MIREKLMKVIAVVSSVSLVLYTGYFDVSLNGICKKAEAKAVSSTETTKKTKEKKVETKSEKKEESKDKNYIVTMKGEGSYEKMKDRADKKEFWPEDKKDKDSKLGGKHMMVLNLSEEELSQIEDLSGVKEIEEDITMAANEVVEPDKELVEKVVAENKSLEFSQWNLDAINLPQNGNTIEEVEIVTGAALKMTWMLSI